MLFLHECYLKNTNDPGTINIIGFMEDTLYVKNEHVYRKTVLGGMSELNNILEKMLLMRLLSRMMYQMKCVYNLKILFTILLSSY